MMKGDTVYYRPNFGRAPWWIRARVEHVHQDGTVTIKALFEVDDAGDDVGYALGYDYRVTTHGLHAQPTVASQ